MRTLAFLLLGAAALRADEVTLKSGGKLSGVVEEKGDQVVVRTEHGTFQFARDKVDKIDRTKSSTLQEYDALAAKADLSKAADVEALLKWAESRKMGEQAKGLRERLVRVRWESVDKSDAAKLEEFAEGAKPLGGTALALEALRGAFALRRAQVGTKDVEKVYQLGLWAKSHGLAADALVCFQDVIAVQPNHEFARRAMGFQLHQGAWMTATEVKQAMGLIEFEGDWMTPGAKEAILTARTLKKEREALEAERKKIDEERAAARAEFEKQRGALDARLLEINRRLDDMDRRRSEIAYANAHACGHAGCASAVVHVHCARAGCTLATVHVHCTRAGCALVGVHSH